MDKNIVIKVENVYKSFKIPHERTNTLKSAALGLFKKNKTYTQYDAARGVSFEVKRGEFLGIIGRNGCGKSTMLKMLAGIYLPDKGRIHINGRLSPFLELGVGFNSELTARENVYLNGTMLGLTRKEIDEQFEEIIKFAELEEFVDQRLKNFSSGMQVRLAFSVAIRAHAEILLIDEVLAVGDENFRAKCFDVFKELKAEGRTIVFVSHGMKEVEDFCDRVIMLKNGEILIDGDTRTAIQAYRDENRLNAEVYDPNKRVMDEKKGLSNILDVSRILESLSLRYFLTDGTLLGLMREKTFIPHDADTDMGVFTEDWTPQHFEDFFARATELGFEIDHIFGIFGKYYEVSLMRHNIKTDLFFYTKREKMRYFHSFRNGGKRLPKDVITYKYPSSLLEKRQKALFYGHEFMIPNNPEKFLEIKYGKDWRTPIVNWDWADGPRNQVKGG